MDLAKATAADIGRGLQAGALDAVEVTEFFLERIAAYPDPAVFTTVTAARARDEAKAAAARLTQGNSRGPLDGRTDRLERPFRHDGNGHDQWLGIASTQSGRH